MPEEFTFEISLSVLNHLGRNLYRSFTTVLGEAISNSWDADAKRVDIFINKDDNFFVIKDDGIGMTSEDFQTKFLKIGYSKRKDGTSKSRRGRAFIGRKGIGKLALLSCADKITVISRICNGEYVGGTIDNAALDKAITEDVTSDEYPLGDWESDAFKEYTVEHKHGTIIKFEGMKGGIKNTLEFLEKVVALYFRFSLHDPSFNIFINGKKVTIKHLDDLAQNTQFLWKINQPKDPYFKLLNVKENKGISMENKNINGFVASVKKPRDLKIETVDERVSVDLFVNGRVRDRNILKHIPTARVAENYFYGQIHYNDLDGDEDIFTSSREGIIADSPKYEEFLEEFRDRILAIVNDWDDFRRDNQQDGDSENPKIPPIERKTEELYNAVSKDYVLPKNSSNRDKVKNWTKELQADAKFNFASYANCFISENLVREYIRDQKINPSSENSTIKKWKTKRIEDKKNANISIELMRVEDDLIYLEMDSLAKLVDKQKGGPQVGLTQDAKEYKPMRDIVMHTAFLSPEAKTKLTSVYENIKSRLINLLAKNREKNN